KVSSGDDLVQLGEGGYPRDRDEVTAPEPADLSFDAALLMGALEPRLAEERLETVVRPQRHEPFGLVTVAPFEDPGDRRPEIVIPDPCRDTPKMAKCQDVALQECLLRLGAVRDVERPPGVRQPHHEHPDLHHCPAMVK